MHMGEVIWSGLLTGWAIAVPVGGIGILLITMAAQRGWRLALAGAAGVALVDTAYAAVAVYAGGPVARWLTPYSIWLKAASAVILAIVGIALIRAAFAEAQPVLDEPGATSFARIFVTFVGLTAVNPATVAYFVAVVLKDPNLVEGWRDSTTFVSAAGAASLAWQVVLVLAGAGIGRVLTGEFGRRLTGLLGGAAVIGLAISAVTG